MPRIPTYDEPQVRREALPGVRQNINAPAAAFGGNIGAAMQEAGRDVGRSGDILTAVAQKRQEEHNRATVFDVYTKLSDQERKYLYDESGAMTKQGANALGMTEKAAKDIGGMAEKLSGTLQNDEQRRMFRELYQRRLDSTLDSMARREAQERQGWQDSVDNGVVKSAAQDAATRWNDPAYINQSADMAEGAVRHALARKGLSPAEIDVEANKTRAGVWKTAIESAMVSNPLEAKRMLDENREKVGEFGAELDKKLEQPVRAAKAMADAGMFSTRKATLPGAVSSKITERAQAEGVDVATALTIAQLENAKGDPNAKNPDSSAQGVFQFTDGTWKAEGGTDADRGNIDRQIELGIKHIKRNQEGLRAALGREPTPAEIYLAHQQGLGGATALLKAGGFKTAVEALTGAGVDPDVAKKAIKNNGGTEEMSAAAFVEKWSQKFANRSVAGADAPKQTLGEKIDAVRAMYPDDPEQAEASIAEVTRQHGLQEAVERDEQEAVMQEYYDALLRTGSPASAVLALGSKVSKLTPEQRVKLDKVVRTVDTNWKYYDEFMAKTPAEKAAVPLEDLMANLGETELKTAIKERSESKSGGASKAPWLQERGTVLKGFAQEAGLVPLGRDEWNEKEQAGYNALSVYMNRKMDAYRMKHGEEMPEQTFREEAARAVVRVQTPTKGMFGNDTTEEMRVFELNGRPIVTIEDLDDVPATVKNDIESALRSRGKEVSDAVVLSLARAFVEGDAAAAQAIMQGAR